MKRENILIVPAGFPVKDNMKRGVYVRDHALATSLNYNTTVCYTTVSIDSLENSISKKYYKEFDKYHVSYWNVNINLKIVPSYLKKIKTIILVYFTIRHIFSILKNKEISIIIAHSLKWSGLSCALISKIKKILYFQINHSSSEKPYAKFAMRWVLNFTYSSADEVWYVSAPQHIKFKKITKKHNYFYLGNPINTNEFSLIKSNVSRSDIKIILIGIPSMRKGIDILIISLSNIFKKYPNFQKLVSVDIIGYSQWIGKFKMMANKYNMDKTIKFLGFLPRNEVADYVKECTFLVAPSREESFLYATAEALSAGKPVVTTKCGGPEWYVNDEMGIVCNNDDIEDFQKGLITMLTTYNQYDSTFLHSEIGRRFSYDSISKKIEDRIAKHINQKRVLK